MHISTFILLCFIRNGNYDKLYWLFDGVSNTYPEWIYGLASRTLRKHIEAVHRGIKYKCDTCSKEFSETKTLKQHIKAIHEGKREHNCEKCGKTFIRAFDLRVSVDKRLPIKIFQNFPKKISNWVFSTK